MKSKLNVEFIRLFISKKIPHMDENQRFSTRMETMGIIYSSGNLLFAGRLISFVDSEKPVANVRKG